MLNSHIGWPWGAWTKRRRFFRGHGYNTRGIAYGIRNMHHAEDGDLPGNETEWMDGNETVTEVVVGDGCASIVMVS